MMTTTPTVEVIDVDTVLQRIEDEMRESRHALIRQHQSNRCDLNSESFRTVWRKYTTLAHQHTQQTIAFNQLFTECINAAMERCFDARDLHHSHTIPVSFENIEDPQCP